MVIRRIEPLSFAKVSGVLYAVLGLVVGGLLSLIALGGGFAASTGDAAFGAIFGVGAIVIFPIGYGLAGFVTTLIGAWLYNVVAGVVGGVEVDVQ